MTTAITFSLQRVTDLGSAHSGCRVLKVYGAISIGGTGFSVELNGPVLLYVLSWTRTEGYGGNRVLPGVLPHQAAAATSGQRKGFKQIIAGVQLISANLCTSDKPAEA